MLARWVSGAGGALVASLIAHEALALQQPDGTTIPTGNGLQSMFDSRGEAVNALADAGTLPETFTPTCALTFEVVQRNAGYDNSFGWYNATGSAPALGDLHEFLTCNDGVGTVKTLDLKNDPNYLGGEIGFYEATGDCATIADHDYIFYSQKDFNPDGNAVNPYVHLLIYDSTVTQNAFYFAWEDLLSGGDNDFDDLTTFVTGIVCSGSGGECQTGQPGVCGLGSEQCQNGVLQCLPLVEPDDEQCDGLDNDCDGGTDEDPGICPPMYVCDEGNCVPECGGGEFDCPTDKICDPDKGLCVDPGCLEVDCPEGQKCDDGVCVAPCDGVVCPYGQVCLVGVCVDPCTLFTCDAEQVCVLGACVEKCQCTGCADAHTCLPDGYCTPDDCVDVDCDPGFHCVPGGTCADNCDGAVCPEDQICELGACIPDPDAGEGGSNAVGVGVGVGGGAGTGGSGGGSGVGGAPTGGDPPAAAPESASGCGCRVRGAETAPPGAWWLAFGALALARRRRSAR